MSNEQWRPVKDWPGYEVSDLGKLRSWRRDGTSSERRSFPRMVGTGMQHGYRFAHLSNGSKAKKVSVHILIAIAFLGDRPAGHQVSHLNGDRLDCRVCNLAWETPRDNNERKHQHGTWQGGENHPSAKLTSRDIIKIRNEARGYGSGRRLAKLYGISESHVSEIRLMREWVHV